MLFFKSINATLHPKGDPEAQVRTDTLNKIEKAGDAFKISPFLFGDWGCRKEKEI